MNLSSRRQLLLDTAFNLFNLHGYHGTGIDRIIKESGTSKATLYKNFTTKEVLILEVLKERYEIVIGQINTYIEKNQHQKEPVLAIFDYYSYCFKQADFNGCMFNKAASEFSNKESLINQFSVSVKNNFRKVFIKALHTKNRDLVTAENKANSIMMLLDGAIIDAQINSNPSAGDDAKKIAEELLYQS